MNKPISRRSFIGTAAGCGAAMGVLPMCLGAADEPKPEEKIWKMKMSASSVCYSSLPIEQACERISALGFDGIDIWAPFAHCTHLADVKTRLGADGLKALLKKHKLKISAFSVYGHDYREYAELLGKVGGGVGVRESQYGAIKPEELTSKMKAFIESLKPLVEIAEKNKSFLAIENHGNALLNTPDSFKAFTDINTSKHLGIALAPYHLQVIKASVPDVIKTCGDQLFFIYAWQHAKGMAQMPGIGQVDCKPWIKALADIKYKHFVNPFMHGEPKPDEMDEAFKKSRAYLLDCYGKTVKPKETKKA
jgi:sugar phosphate isomerase/epimerase